MTRKQQDAIAVIVALVILFWNFSPMVDDLKNLYRHNLQTLSRH